MPNNTAPEENHIATTITMKSDATAVSDTDNFTFEIECLLEIIIEESLALYELFPDGDWSAGETTFATISEFDIISKYLVIPRLYPPKAKRLLARNTAMPDSRTIEIPTLPPEMES